MPRNYTTRRERRTLWIAFFLLLALAAFLLWQELSPWEKAPATNPPAAGLTLERVFYPAPWDRLGPGGNGCPDALV